MFGTVQNGLKMFGNRYVNMFRVGMQYVQNGLGLLENVWENGGILVTKPNLEIASME